MPWLLRLLKKLEFILKNGRKSMGASKEDWLNIFDMLSDSVSQSNKCLNEYLEEFISINITKGITGKQNRIKSNVSFVEKLVRNDYLNKWDY